MPSACSGVTCASESSPLVDLVPPSPTQTASSQGSPSNQQHGSKSSVLHVPSWDALQSWLSSLQPPLQGALAALTTNISSGSLPPATRQAPQQEQKKALSAASSGFPPLLPPQKKGPKKTLVLDLDHTLIDCLLMRDHSNTEPDFIYRDCEGGQAKVWKRPHLMEFLHGVQQDFEVVLFTAAGQRHADAVLGIIDPAAQLVEHRLYGHHTVSAPQWSWVKDLSRLGRDLAHVVLVDDCEAAALHQPGNWISIKAFYQAEPEWKKDTALLDILTFLRDKIVPADDVRTAISQHYNQRACRPRRSNRHSFSLERCSALLAAAAAVSTPATSSSHAQCTATIGTPSPRSTLHAMCGKPPVQVQFGVLSSQCDAREEAEPLLPGLQCSTSDCTSATLHDDQDPQSPATPQPADPKPTMCLDSSDLLSTRANDDMRFDFSQMPTNDVVASSTPVTLGAGLDIGITPGMPLARGSGGLQALVDAPAGLRRSPTMQDLLAPPPMSMAKPSGEPDSSKATDAAAAARPAGADDAQAGRGVSRSFSLEAACCLVPAMPLTAVPCHDHQAAAPTCRLEVIGMRAVAAEPAAPQEYEEVDMERAAAALVTEVSAVTGVSRVSTQDSNDLSSWGSGLDNQEGMEDPSQGAAKEEMGCFVTPASAACAAAALADMDEEPEGGQGEGEGEAQEEQGRVEQHKEGVAALMAGVATRRKHRVTLTDMEDMTLMTLGAERMSAGGYAGHSRSRSAVLTCETELLVATLSL
mmetsp:Transcript_319/g.637  ORF Transcript_319/g.637 Transcript_319/m.637 type:complete len:753 (-) Transcript_319:732-2990(-)|eukprot:CAMPEP_0202905188 /NCGR_PEP_ID=MMETSP1392-20130828/32991_1 /ASSEMBLY_ACC=CAM_ASM_000868 /TAXON_ID=225041 /ORGANISM="Chlamydomonas chlamydogama, Strain SAG 11-48b" /LENGTH=752 /DNA_ID=CAMNT_0049593167 /DNA_START=160 /DNA_END=2418 /DNA_ORIENTATION=+